MNVIEVGLKKCVGQLEIGPIVRVHIIHVDLLKICIFSVIGNKIAAIGLGRSVAGSTGWLAQR